MTAQITEFTQTPQGLHDQAIGLFIFFPVLCTVTLFLRLYVRTKLCKGAFGWDDVALILTWVCPLSEVTA